MTIKGGVANFSVTKKIEKKYSICHSIFAHTKSTFPVCSQSEIFSNII